MSFETDFKLFLEKIKVEFEDHCFATNYPDFKVTMKSGKFFWVETKEKKQNYRMDKWPNFEKNSIDQENAFIEDELSVRRLARFAVDCSFLVVKNIAIQNHKYYVFSIIDLFCVPKSRVNRETSPGSLKGKWLLDFRWAKRASSIEEVFRILENETNSMEVICGLIDDQKKQMTECYGEYIGEKISRGGSYRTLIYRKFDLEGK